MTDNPSTEEMVQYLERAVRLNGGNVSPMDAVKLLMGRYFITKEEADAILQKWMDTDFEESVS